MTTEHVLLYFLNLETLPASRGALITRSYTLVCAARLRRILFAKIVRGFKGPAESYPENGSFRK